MEKRQAIVQAATALFGSIGFDGTTTLAIADEASVTEPLIYYHFKGKDDLFTHSLELAFNEYFARFDQLPNRSSTEINGLLRQRVFQLADTDTDGVKDATIEFCRRSLTGGQFGIQA